MKGVPQAPEFHPEGDVWTHTLLMLEQLENPSVTLALGVLLHDVGKPATIRFAERIRFDGHVEKGARLTVQALERLRVFEGGDRTGNGPGPTPHALRPRHPNEREQAQKVPPAARFRRTFGAPPAGLSQQPPKSCQLRLRSGQAGRTTDRRASPATSRYGRGLDCSGLQTGACIQEDPHGTRRSAARRNSEDQR